MLEGNKTISAIINNERSEDPLITGRIFKDKEKMIFGLFCFCRSNITVFSVIFLLTFVIATNMLTFNYNFQNGSILFSYLDGKGGGENNGNIIVKSINDLDEYQIDKKGYVSIVKIASADSSLMGNLQTSQDRLDTDNYMSAQTDSLDLENKQSVNLVIIQNNSILSPASYYDESLSDLKYGITKYKVQPGDTPSSIATSFGISTYTVLWANNLRVGDYIKPGQELEILPVSGIKHIIKPGDSISNIAKEYKADKEEIIVFNDFPADGSLPKGSEGKVLIIPNGQKEAPLKPAPQIKEKDKVVISSQKYTYKSTNLNPNNGHRFPYGYCTWYVASKVYVPWGGHAKSWLTNSRAYGYSTGKIPVAGSIVVTTENRWYGHVAYVEAVNGNTITVSEMNYVGWGRKSVRVLNVNSSVIRGYVYMN